MLPFVRRKSYIELLVIINMTESFLKYKYEKAGQGHLFKYWDTLSEDERQSFASQLSTIQDPAAFLSDVQEAIKYSSSLAESKIYKPLPTSICCSSTIDESKKTLSIWHHEGLKLISQSKVGIILMAGGQGTRLGSSAPKGMYNVGLPSGKSLFQLQCERILKLRQLASEEFSVPSHNVHLPLYIMTSKPTRAATEMFFTKHHNFGLEPNDVIFFNQGILPAVSMDGKQFLLGSKNSIVESPDGNGGLYKALHDNKILDDFHKRSIEHIHAYCVDNILVKVADPVFIGYSAINKYDIATKVVRKQDPSEKVGLIVLDANTNAPCVIEYSEISKELSEMKDPQDPNLLMFRAANIVNHYYNVKFLSEMIPKWISSRKYLPYHIAKKKIKYFDYVTGVTKNPETPNGVKMEQFIFDVFPSVKLSRFGCLEVQRSDEFSPLKNAPGSGSSCPETCRLEFLKRSTNWLLKWGAQVDHKDTLVEVDPSTSYDGEGLQFVKGKLYHDGDIL